MKIDLGLDDELNAIWNKLASSATGLTTRIETLLTAAFHSASNPFGDVAKKDAGSDPGNVPLIGSSGDLAKSMFPQFTASGMTGFISPERFPELNASKVKIATVGIEDSIDRLSVDHVPQLPASVITNGTILDGVLPPINEQIKSNSISGNASTITLRFSRIPQGTARSVLPYYRSNFPSQLQATGKATFEGVGEITNDGSLIIKPVIPILSPNYAGQ